MSSIDAIIKEKKYIKILIKIHLKKMTNSVSDMNYIDYYSIQS